MSTQATRALRRPGRAPGAINLGIVLAALALLLPLLLHAASESPPTAAEFAPNAQQVIKKAPPGSGGASNGQGNGGAGAGPGGHPTTPPPPPPPPPATKFIPANQVLHCVGPPPLRQIEDPQSPPCIAYWKGDNGGATATGVTRDKIYIAVPTPESKNAQYSALFNFFNKRFQFYGRKIVPEFCSSSGGGSGSSDQANQVADAAMAAAGCGGMPKPFASTFYRQNNGAYYMPAMACTHHTIVVGSYSPYDSAFLNRCAPYQYQYPMEVDEEFANIGQWVCNRLAGRKASYGAGNDGETPGKPITSLTRKFGILLEPFTDDDPVLRRDALTPMMSQLHACGVNIPTKDAIINPVVGNDFDPSSAQNAMLQLRSDNVTSVICMCNFFSFGTLARAADSSAYQPEWITSTFGLNDVNSSFTLGAAPNDQLAHTFGVTFQPRMVSPLENPYNIALQEGDPSQSPDTTSLVEAELEIYRALLLLASGIQMAGPHLDVQHFRDGLRNAKFPNPITSIHEGAVDVKPGGYSMTADGAEWWYSIQDNGPFTDSSSHPGTVCYLNRGQRYVLGGWPRGPAPFFKPGTCYSGG